MKTQNLASGFIFKITIVCIMVFCFGGFLATAQVNQKRTKTSKKEVVQKAQVNLQQLIQQKSSD